MRIVHKPLLLFGVIIMLVTCSNAREKGTIAKLEAVSQGKPFIITLGRGSGQMGLDVIRVDETGKVVATRTTMVDEGGVVSPKRDILNGGLNDEELKSLVSAVNAADVFGLDDKYSKRNVYDGTQWVIEVRQGVKRKKIYCDNMFPSEIQKIASVFDEIIANHKDFSWKAIPEDEYQGLQKALWDKIE